MAKNTLPEMMMPLADQSMAVLIKTYNSVCKNDPKAAHPDTFGSSKRRLILAIKQYDPKAESPAGAIANGATAIMSRATREREIEMAAKKAKKDAARPAKTAKKVKALTKAVKGKAAATGTGRARTGVGVTIRAQIAKKPDMPNAEIATLARKAHPDSSTNAACVAWYKNDMRKKGEI